MSDSQDGEQDDRAEPLIQQYRLILDRHLEAHPEVAKCVVCCAGCGIRFLTHPRNRGRTDLRCPFGCRERHRRKCANERSCRYYQTAEGREKKEWRNAERTGWPRPPDPLLPLGSSADSKEPEVGNRSEISQHGEVAAGPRLSSPSAALPAVDVRDGSAVVDRSDVTDASSSAADPVRAANAAGPKRCPVRGCEAPPELVELSIPLPSEIPAPGEDSLVWDLGGVKLTAWLVATTPVLPYVQLLLKAIGPLRLCRRCLIQWLLEKLRQRSIAFRLHRQYVLRFLHMHPP